MKKVLIANRGEIALRVIRACKELGIKTVAVHSMADVNSLHVKYADEDVCIGPPPAKDSYLNIRQLLSAAEITNSDGVHPGYGFLSENSHFAEICKDNAIEFIGPPAECIRNMGDKAMAKAAMKRANVPCIPDSNGILATEADALKMAQTIGYPVILKAVAGGGGRGMRVALNPEDLKKQFVVAATEAKACFSNGALYMEKYFTKPRHIEIQLMGDKHGNVVHLFERDCSVQRRHQKLIEESPSPAFTPEMRAELGKAAADGARALGYYSAGTMEFLHEDGKSYFMEMNTRIQVEHPVTEMVTGVDLIQEMLRVANGEKLTFCQEELTVNGHSIECRINAEDPARNFTPSPGTITYFHVPGGPGVRVDTHCYQGYQIPPNYDSMIAKLIVHAKDRKQAIQRMLRALDEFVIEGIKTTIPVHKRILKHPVFQSGDFNTKFLEEYPEIFEGLAEDS
jgi:acetyl-CoA carboxylase, biotin carboxylase subunit